MLIGPLVFNSGCEMRRKDDLLALAPAVTQGVITNAEISKTYDRSSSSRVGSRNRNRYRYSYLIDVSYGVEGTRYVIHKSVSKQYFDEHCPNGKPNQEPLEVEYVKADPSIATIEGGRFDSPLKAYLIMGIGALVLVFGIIGTCYLYQIGG